MAAVAADGFKATFRQGVIIAEATAVCRLHTPQKAFILPNMYARSQTLAPLAIITAPTLLLASSLLLAGLLLRASAN